MNLRVSRAVVSQLRFCFLALAAAVVLCIFAPAPALAAENVAYVKDSAGNVTNYTDEDAAVEAAYGKGKTLVLLKNWDRRGSIYIDNDKELTIDMNGYRIRTDGYDRVIYMRSGSSLTLTSSRPRTTISYVGYDPEDGSQESMQVVSGGLITGGEAYDGAGIKMFSGCHLTLDGVTVAGNKTTGSKDKTASGAGICAEKGCTIDLTGGARVQNNHSISVGGGIYAIADNVTININNAHVDSNRAARAGGIYINGSNNKVALNKKATIDGNIVTGGGGGIVIGGSGFSLVSEDGTGSISNNKANGTYSGSSKEDVSGGGIHVRDKPGNACIIKGLKVCNNYAAYDGGGIELDQNLTTVSQCTITGNTADKDAGGVCVYAKNCTIDGCTITENACDLDGKNYEGGGVFVSYHYDVNMSGVCYIKGNTRGKDSGNADDVFLSTISGQTGYAYITGKLAKGSTVGVRTGITGDRMIAQKFSCDTKDCLFIDLSGYYVSYGSDHGGDAWQRHVTKDFSVKVNGSEVGSYKQGTKVSVSADSSADSKDADKVFWHWDRDKTTGLNPINSYITEAGSYKSGLSFAMPQNDVNLIAVFADRVAAGELTVTAPVAGEELSSEGTFTRTDGGTGGVGSTSVKVSWYEVASDGSEQQVSGTAKIGTTYRARVWIDDDADVGLYFGNSKGTQVTVKSGDEEGTPAADTQTRDDGSLYVKTANFQTAKPTVVSIDTVYATTQVGTTKINFLNSLPIEVTAKTNAGTTVTLRVHRSEDAGLGDLIGPDGTVVMPTGGKITVHVPVWSETGEVEIPMDMNTVPIEVTVTEAPEEIATPTVDPAAGIYSVTDDSDKFENGKLKIHAGCTTEGATIKYRVDYLGDDGWVQGEVKTYSDAIYLERNPQGVRAYDLVVWAVKGDVPSETASNFYLINDMDTRAVTVKQTDTGTVPQETTIKTYEVRKGSSFTVEAPVREGYKFEKWLVGDDECATAALTLDAVDSNTTVTAVYNPVVSEFDVDFAAPVAHETLATSATVKAKAGDSDEAFDISSHFVGVGDKAGVAWTPEGDTDGTAAHETNYAASLTLKSATSSTVKYVLASDVTIKYEGNVIEGGAAYIAESADGTKSLCLDFPTTGPWEYPVLSGLSDVELSFDDALDYQESQDAGDEPGWGLPRRVLVTCECGESVPLDIVWNKVDGFDKTKLETQEFEVTGTIAFPDYINASDKDGQPVSNVVTVKVTVEAPETVATPTASLASGTYAGTQSVQLDCETGDATIRYTTDGSEPTEDSAVYEGGKIEVAHSTTIKAKAFCEAMIESETATFTYAITHEVSFDSAGGSAVAAQTVEDGAAATEPEAPTRDGYDFKGWMLDGAAYDFASPVTGDLTLTASWQKRDGGSDDEPDDEPDDDQPDDDKGDKDSGADKQSGGKKSDGKRGALPGTGDASAAAGVMAAAGTVLAALGARTRRKR